MDQIYIEALNEAKTLSDSDYLLIETSAEDLKISIGTLKQLLSVATANKLTNPFELTLSGDATGTTTIDGSESADIDVSLSVRIRRFTGLILHQKHRMHRHVRMKWQHWAWMQ